MLISGRVQGVYFRAYTQEAAIGAGVRGWVRNLPDGRVEALFEGGGASVERVLEWCRQGSPHSRVDSVDIVDDEPAGGKYTGFEIRY